MNNKSCLVLLAGYPPFTKKVVAYGLTLVAGDQVCDLIVEGTPRGQVMEVVEHILPYVSDLGLHYTFPGEWGIAKNSVLGVAMPKAIDQGWYDVGGYDDIDQPGGPFPGANARVRLLVHLDRLRPPARLRAGRNRVDNRCREVFRFLGIPGHRLLDLRSRVPIQSQLSALAESNPHGFDGHIPSAHHTSPRRDLARW